MAISINIETSIKISIKIGKISIKMEKNEGNFYKNDATSIKIYKSLSKSLKDTENL